MTEEQQRIAIAEACGWTVMSERFDHIKQRITRDPPDYLNDLNAIHEAVKTLPQNMKPSYFSCLCAVVSVAISPYGYSEVTEANAAQRAEAFLRTIGKWTNNQPT